MFTFLNKAIERFIFSFPQLPCQYIFPGCQERKLFNCAPKFNSTRSIHPQLLMFHNNLVPLFSVIIIHIEVPKTLHGAIFKH
uniref:Uncharacterized protein MANES_14G000100 n=1 Tax=Rhizophora mucronata TaxID=61149 RepID=A0A2P2MQZ1_RHIMU